MPLRTVEGRRLAPGEPPTGADFTYTVVAPAADQSGHDRRGTRRLRTRLREGVVGERKHRAIAACRILDRTATGARLQLDEDRPLPPRFVLTDGAAREMFQATLVWQTGREAGVRLMSLD